MTETKFRIGLQTGLTLLSAFCDGSPAFAGKMIENSWASALL